MEQYDMPALLDFASGLARDAGEVMRRYFYGEADKQVTVKSDHSPVTVADKMINQTLIEAVTKEYPQHGVLGEEASSHADRRELWVCDPIDGTRGFIYGDPTSMFSLAFAVDGEPLLAVAYDPYQDQLFTAIKGQGAHCNDKPIHVSQKQQLDGAVIIGPGSMTELEEGLEMYRSLRKKGAMVRLQGGGVFKMCLVADGHVEGRLFPGKGAHDIAAVKLIIEEAGGKVTDLYGNKQRYDQPIRGAIASNGAVHDELVAVARDYGVEKLLEHGY